MDRLRDWLGTGNIANFLRKYRSFKQARAFVRSLGLKDQRQWHTYCKSGKKPNDIPSNANQVYDSWMSWPDWLGHGFRRGGWRSFEDARAFARRLKLKSFNDWRAYCRSGKKPDDIPTTPPRTYAGAWAGWPDWVGYKARASRFRRGRSFKNARTFVRSLKLKNSRDWLAYCKSGKKPDDIPASPASAFAKSGWVSWPDWLGYPHDQRS